MSIDRLDALLQHFSVSARMFHAGALCGLNDFVPQPGVGQLHLVQRGDVVVEHPGQPPHRVEQPSLLFYPRPLAHRFVTDPQRGADMACAHVQFNRGSGNPLAQALPGFVALPLAELDGAQPVLEVLFREAFGQRCGRQAVVDRLFEVVLIQILRRLMDSGVVAHGLLAGMAHPQLQRALVALHAAPAQPWSLPELAQAAGMSRTVFAATFKDVVGSTPGDYVSGWRLSLAQQRLRQRRPLKLIVDEVGYGSAAALSRAFKAYCGMSPREWMRREENFLANVTLVL